MWLKANITNKFNSKKAQKQTPELKQTKNKKPQPKQNQKLENTVELLHLGKTLPNPEV